MNCLHRALPVMPELRRGCGLIGLLLGMLVVVWHAGIVSAGAREWTTANPAAGVAVRSAPNFRVAAISRVGNAPAVARRLTDRCRGNSGLRRQESAPQGVRESADCSSVQA